MKKRKERRTITKKVGDIYITERKHVDSTGSARIFPKNEARDAYVKELEDSLKDVLDMNDELQARLDKKEVKTVVKVVKQPQEVIKTKDADIFLKAKVKELEVENEKLRNRLNFFKRINDSFKRITKRIKRDRTV